MNKQEIIATLQEQMECIKNSINGINDDKTQIMKVEDFFEVVEENDKTGKFDDFDVFFDNGYIIAFRGVEK